MTVMLREFSPERDSEALKGWLANAIHARGYLLSHRPIEEWFDRVGKHAPNTDEAVMLSAYDTAAEGHSMAALVSFNMWYPFEGVMIGEAMSDPNQVGLGIGLQAFSLGLNHIFATETGVHKVAGQILEDNIPAIATVEKLGFSREGLLRGQIPLPDGSRKNAYQYGILREEWAEMEALAREAKQ